MFKIVALMGEAGTGKDTIMQNILKKYPMEQKCFTDSYLTELVFL